MVHAPDRLKFGPGVSSKIVAGPIVNEYGQFLGHRWHKDPNGFVSPMNGFDPTSFEMLIFMRSFSDTEDPKNDVKVIGSVQYDEGYHVVHGSGRVCICLADLNGYAIIACAMNKHLRYAKW